MDSKQSKFLSSTLRSLLMTMMAEWKWVRKNGFYTVYLKYILSFVEHLLYTKLLYLLVQVVTDVLFKVQ